MPLISIINVIDSLDSDSERDALSAKKGKELYRMLLKEIADRIAADEELWAALRKEIADRIAAVAAEQAARIAADNAEAAARAAEDTRIWNKINNLTFEDIGGMIPGTRVWAY